MAQEATPSPKPSPTPQHCEDVIDDCNVALNKADSVIQALKSEVSTQQKALDSCQGDNQTIRMDLQKELDKDSNVLRNPWFDGAVGAVLGILAYSYLHK